MLKRAKKKTTGLTIAGSVLLFSVLVLFGPSATVVLAQSDLTVFQKEGATDEQQSHDRPECHLRAIKETGFDPAAPAEAMAPPPPSRDHPIRTPAELEKHLQAQRWKQRTKFNRALKACLEARGYAIIEH